MSDPRVKKRSYKAKNEKAMDETEKEENRRRRHVLGQLSRAPGKCPVGNCDQVVFPSGLLVHLLHKHTHNPNTNVIVLYDEHPIRRTFNPDSFEYDKPQALTLILYAGTQGKPHTRPSRRYLSFSNCGLLNNRRRYEHHLALVLMICKTSWFSMLPDRKHGQKLEDKIGSPENTIYVLWLVCPATSSRMFYTLTVFDRYYIQSRSVIRKARNYVHPQHPKEFLNKENDYLLLRHEEAMELMSAEGDAENPTPYINMELLVQEEPRLIELATATSTQFLYTYKGLRSKMPRNKLELYRSSNGKLSLNRKPLSNPMIPGTIIKSPLAYFPESGSFMPFERVTDRQWKNSLRISRQRTRTKVTTTEESSDSSDNQQYSLHSDVKVAPNRDRYQEKRAKVKRAQEKVKDEGQLKPLELGPDLRAPKVSRTEGQRSKKKSHSRYKGQLEDELVKHVIAAERKKSKARQLLKSVERYLEAYQESDEEDSSSKLKHILKEFAEDRYLGGKDLSPQSVNRRTTYIDCQKKRHMKSKSESPERPSGSREKAGSSREASRKCMEEFKESSIRDLEESIMNLRIPITNEVLQTVKEAVVNSVKDAVRKVAEETIITKLDVESELRLGREQEQAKEPKPETKTKSKPEMQPQVQTKAETEAEIETGPPPKRPTKIPGVTVNIETELASDCDLYSESN
ncbi:uncharacterized protein LOC6551064 [Drosophila erecta]|uniref:uncharacterized protein LOC6551064 n=1 Tax=Drosophila erecta TaxID=7220 RepID=UPI000F0609DC|nr:uncharacterized protein LOC6551064 [Drosophila erecta]